MRLTVLEVAKLLKISRGRVTEKIKQGHFPNHARCECQRTIMIPTSDLSLPTPDRREKKV